MKHIFIDTSGWDALADKADKDHAKALQFRNEIAGKCKLVTSNYILDELYTLLLMNVGFQTTINYKEKLDILITEHVLDEMERAIKDGLGDVSSTHTRLKCLYFSFAIIIPTFHLPQSAGNIAICEMALHLGNLVSPNPYMQNSGGLSRL